VCLACCIIVYRRIILGYALVKITKRAYTVTFSSFSDENKNPNPGQKIFLKLIVDENNKKL